MQKYLYNYFLCQTHNQPLNLVCLDEDCSKKGLICAHCQYKEHKHTVRSLGLLISQVNKDMKSYEVSLSLLSQIDQIFIAIKQQIRKLDNEQQRKSVMEVANNYFQAQIRNIFKRSKLVEEYTSKKQKSIQQLNQFVVKYNFIDKSINPNSYSNIQFQIRSRLQQVKNSSKQLQECLKNNQSLNKIMKIFQVIQGKIKYYFNPQKCHRDIIITQKTKVSLKQGYSYRIGTILPPIRKQGAKTQKKSCHFKIIKVSSLVGVGVVYRKKAQTSNFLFSAYSQHGCYFTTSSGYTYNESNSSFNSQVKNWSFTTNEVIKVTIDPKQKKIIFQKQGKDSFSFPYDQKPDMQLNFGVMLCQQHQCVQLVDA